LQVENLASRRCSCRWSQKDGLSEDLYTDSVLKGAATTTTTSTTQSEVFCEFGELGRLEPSEFLRCRAFRDVECVFCSSPRSLL
ncbi:Uncharacterized protein DAT39_011608, partial [Clarias magur]